MKTIKDIISIANDLINSDADPKRAKKDLAALLMPDKPIHIAQIRLNEWLGERRTPTDFTITSRLVEWVKTFKAPKIARKGAKAASKPKSNGKGAK